MSEMADSVFRNAVRRFNNIADMSVMERGVTSPLVGTFLAACNAILRKIDRDMPDSADLTRRLWWLRTSVLFGMTDFDHPAMALSERLESIRSHAARVPYLVTDLESLTDGVKRLIKAPENPKRNWLISNIGSSAETVGMDSREIAVFAAMTGGRSDYSLLRSILPDQVSVIESRSQLPAHVFDRIIVLGTCQYLSMRTYTELFHTGCSRRMEVLCYPGEYFVLRERPFPPECQLSKGRLNTRHIAVSRQGGADISEADADGELAVKLWDVVHDGERAQRPGRMRAKYILLSTDQGFFVPAEGYSVLVCRDGSAGEPSLFAAGAEDLAEDDLLIIQVGNTGRMLDFLSSLAGFETKLEESCDWRSALERFLLTGTPEELAIDMHDEGAQGLALAQSIRHWAQGSVYGPGHRNELRALLSVLLAHGYLGPLVDLESFVDAHWKGLQEARGIRHRAGVKARQELLRQVLDAFGQQERLSDGQQLNLASGLVLQVHRVVAVDDRVSWVLPSQLHDLRPIRGDRWHV
jgi:hypothetical protein